MSLDLKALLDLPYASKANVIFSHFWKELPTSKINTATTLAYSRENFATETITPLAQISESEFNLELYHGPTSNFKDLPFQLIPHLLPEKSTVVVSSAGNGSISALKSFAKYNDYKVILFFPLTNVDENRKNELLSYNSETTFVVGVDSELDKIHSELDRVFLDEDYLLKFAKQDINLVPIHMIPNSRIIPLLVPLVSAYCSLVKNNIIKFGNPINIINSETHTSFNKAIDLAKEIGLPIEPTAKIKIFPKFKKEQPQITIIDEKSTTLYRDAICRINGIKNFLNMICLRS